MSPFVWLSLCLLFVVDLPCYMTTGVNVDFISNCFFTCKDRALERDRPYLRKKKVVCSSVPRCQGVGATHSPNQLIQTFSNPGLGCGVAIASRDPATGDHQLPLADNVEDKLVLSLMHHMLL